MQKIIGLLTFYLLFTAINTNAQFTNMAWKLGKKCALDFKSGAAVVSITDSCKSSMDNTNTSISDRNGNIIFYSNACRVYDRNGHVMPNGSGFNQGTYSNNYVNTDYYPPFKAATIVPFPNDSNKFYMFYLNMEYNVDGDYIPDKLYYLVVDRTLNGGLGDVTVKDQIAISGDTLNKSTVFAIKHGNGKDWWLIVRKHKGNKYYKVLVDSAGVHTPTTQIIGNDFNYPIATQGAGNMSLQGNKLCFSHETNNAQYFQMDLFDFDRCTGMLHVNQTIFHQNVVGDSIGWGPSCFSPSGRFLYLSDGFKVYQMDLNSTNLLSSVQVVGINTILYRAFFKMEIAPDGKIYVSPYGGYNFMSVINKPDSLGMACNFVENAIQFGATIANGPWADGGLPNTPNFALGPVSPQCAVGLTEIDDNELNIYPNPCTSNTVKLYNTNYKSIAIYNLIGVMVYEQNVVPNTTNEISITNFSKGIYLIKATDKNGNATIIKFVKQ